MTPLMARIAAGLEDARLLTILEDLSRLRLISARGLSEREVDTYHMALDRLEFITRPK